MFKNFAKNFAVYLAIAGLGVGTTASARDLRPAVVSFSPTAVQGVDSLLPAPAKPRFAKRNGLAPLLIVVIVVAVGAVGTVAATSGGSSSPS